jgi:uncharacterized protein
VAARRNHVVERWASRFVMAHWCVQLGGKNVGEDHFNIPESVACALEPLRRCEKIKQVILFGSRAVGDHDPRSDVDLAISGPGLSKGDVALLRDEIERAPSLFRIAVSHLEKMPATLRERVMKQGIIIHDREKALR